MILRYDAAGRWASHIEVTLEVMDGKFCLGTFQPFVEG